MSLALIIILVVVGVIFLFSLYGSFVKWRVSHLTIWKGLKKLDIKQPISEYTKLFLDENGLVDVQVKRVGFFASAFIGNTYSVSKKMVRLGWGTAKRSNIICLAISCRLVGLAKMHDDGVKGIRLVEFNRWFGWLPALFLPLVLIGLIVDFVSTGKIGIYTVALSAIGLIIILVCLIISIIAASKFIKACNVGQNILKEAELVPDKEFYAIKKLYSAWKQLAVLQVLMNAFGAILFLVNVVLAALNSFGR